MHWHTVLFLGFATAAVAVPRALPKTLLTARQEDGDICSYDRGDPNSMRASGADVYLSDFLTSEEDQAWCK
jgi:hypothetical protein